MLTHKNAFELLEALRKKNEKQIYGFSEIKEYISFKARDKGVPVIGEFELTPLCNFNCKMCYVHLDADQLNGQSILSVHEWKNLIHQAWEAGMISAILTGGECLVYPEFDEIYLYLQSLGCQVTVLTNGFLLDEKRIDFFKEHSPYLIQVTLYGWNEETYERVTGKQAFNIVTNNIRQAIEAKLPIYITTTPNRYIGEDILETIKVARDLCKNVLINSYISPPREETGRSKQKDDADIELYIRAYQFFDRLEGRETIEIDEGELPPCGSSSSGTPKCGLTCGGGRSGFAIDWKGTLMPCLDMTMIREYPLVDGFNTAWTKINQAVNSWPRVPECEGCAYNGICNRCAAHMLQFAKPGMLPTDLCEQTKELVRKGVRHLPACE